MLNSSVISEFSRAFLKDHNISTTENPPLYLDPEPVLSSFNSGCSTILDAIAPLKVKRVKTKVEPWFNDTTRALRQTCRRAERNWRKDRLQVSFEMLRDSLHSYQKAVKAKVK